MAGTDHSRAPTARKVFPRGIRAIGLWQPIAISAGLTPADLSTIRAGGAPAGASPLENALLVAATALVQREEFDDAAYADAVACAGKRSLFELCALVGYYRMLALTMRVFGIE